MAIRVFDLGEIAIDFTAAEVYNSWEESMRDILDDDIGRRGTQADKFVQQSGKVNEHEVLGVIFPEKPHLRHALAVWPAQKIVNLVSAR